MKSRDTFIFYRSIADSAKELSDDDRLKLYDAIIEYSLNFEEPILSGLPSAFFTLLKPVLSKNNANYINGSKPKVSQTEAKQKPKVNESKGYKDKDKYKDKYIPFFLSVEQMDNIITYRREIKKPLKTERGLKGIETSFKECMTKFTFDEVFDTMLRKEWQSVKLEWLEKEVKPIHNQIVRKSNPALGGYN